MLQFAYCQKIQQYDVITTSNYVNMSIKGSEMLEKLSTLICVIFMSSRASDEVARGRFVSLE